MCLCKYACVWLWIGHGMFVSPYVEKVNQGTIKRTGSDRVCRGQPKDSEKRRKSAIGSGGRPMQEERYRGVSQRRDWNRPVVS